MVSYLINRSPLTVIGCWTPEECGHVILPIILSLECLVTHVIIEQVMIS